MESYPLKRKLQVMRMSNRRNFSNNALIAKRSRICEQTGRAETDGIMYLIRPWGVTQKNYQWSLLGLCMAAVPNIIHKRVTQT